MSKDLLDYKGENIVSGDIIKRENIMTGEITFFKYESITKTIETLYIYDENKETSDNNINNININDGISLLSNDTFKWSKVLDTE